MNCLKGSLLSNPPLPNAKAGKEKTVLRPNSSNSAKRSTVTTRPVSAIPPRGPVNPYMLNANYSSQGPAVAHSKHFRPPNDVSSMSVYYQHSSNMEEADLLEKVSQQAKRSDF